MRFVQTTPATWDESWQWAWPLDRQGRVIPLTDIVIASCARREGARVLTNDRRFELVPKFTVLRPE